MSNDTIYKNIEKLGERYIKVNLSGPARSDKLWSDEKLECDWWEALKFFFSHSFMRGRRDKLSNEYYCFTLNVLEDFLTISEIASRPGTKFIENCDLFDIEPLKELKQKNRGKGSVVKQPDFHDISNRNRLVEMLTTKRPITLWWKNESYKKEIRLDNDEDVMMVLDTLKFINQNTAKEEYNVYVFLKRLIYDNKVKIAYDNLSKIRAVADKIAAFILRDIGLLNPEIKVANNDYRYFFPVDVWVKVVTERIGYEGKDINDARQILIQRCVDFNINPLKFASGLWYLGFTSLDLAMEFLSKSEIT